MHDERLQIAGLLAGGPLEFDQAACAAFPQSAQVADVGALAPGRSGRGLRLAALAERARVRPEARWVHIASRDPAYAVSVPIEEVLEHGLVVYGAASGPLSAEKGGPFRLVVCGHPDECVNVKALQSLTFSDSPGRDTRPLDDEEHRKLHAAALKKRAV